MRFGADSRVAPGTYRVTWTNQQNSNNSEAQGEYAALQETEVEVLAANGSIDITIADLPKLDIGATSVPIGITIARPAAESFHFELDFVDPTHASKITIEPKTVDFNDKETYKTFTLTAREHVEDAFLKLVPFGTGEPAFSLTTNEIPLEISTIVDVIPPKMYGKVMVQEAKRNTAKIRVHYSEIATVYWMFSNRGTK
jgi:hypothetical protein